MCYTRLKLLLLDLQPWGAAGNSCSVTKKVVSPGADAQSECWHGGANIDRLCCQLQTTKHSLSTYSTPRGAGDSGAGETGVLKTRCLSSTTMMSRPAIHWDSVSQYSHVQRLHDLYSSQQTLSKCLLFAGYGASRREQPASRNVNSWWGTKRRC